MELGAATATSSSRILLNSARIFALVLLKVTGSNVNYLLLFISLTLSFPPWLHDPTLVSVQSCNTNFSIYSLNLVSDSFVPCRNVAWRVAETVFLLYAEKKCVQITRLIRPPYGTERTRCQQNSICFEKGLDWMFLFGIKNEGARVDWEGNSRNTASSHRLLMIFVYLTERNPSVSSIGYIHWLLSRVHVCVRA